MKLKFSPETFFLVFFLISMTFYNVDNTVFRLIVILYIALYPIFICLGLKKLKLSSKEVIFITISFLWFIYFVFWFLINLKNINYDFSGPNVEMLTPILFFVVPFKIIALNYYIKNKPYITNNAFSLFIRLSFLILLIDLIIRYFSAPQCFLNYSCRYDAKTVGMFSTTNALGTSLITILLALIVINFKKFFYSSFFNAVLITTMARAAIVSYIFSYIFHMFLRSNYLVKFFVLSLFLILFYQIYLLNPLGIFDDGSFISKLLFFESAFNTFNNPNILDLIVGFGANFDQITTVVGVNDWSPHSPILKSYFYYGFIGLILYLSFLAFFVLLNKNLFIPVLGYFVCGFAGAPIYFPTLFVIFFIIQNYQNEKINSR